MNSKTVMTEAEFEEFISTQKYLELKKKDIYTSDWKTRITANYFFINLENHYFLISQTSTFEREIGQFHTKENEVQRLLTLLGKLEWVAIPPPKQDNNLIIKTDPKNAILFSPKAYWQEALENNFNNATLFVKTSPILTPSETEDARDYSFLYEKQFKEQQLGEILTEFIGGKILH